MALKMTYMRLSISERSFMGVISKVTVDRADGHWVSKKLVKGITTRPKQFVRKRCQ